LYGSFVSNQWLQMTAKGDNSVNLYCRIITLDQSVSLILDVKFDVNSLKNETIMTISVVF